jgi:uncharacterized protein YutE (UPF0331/DUF86 family)
MTSIQKSCWRLLPDEVEYSNACREDRDYKGCPYRIVHFYHEITNEELYAILQNDLKDIEQFVNEIGKFIKPLC